LCKDGGQIDIGDVVIGSIAGIKGEAAGEIEGEACFEGIFCRR
jgi:hypothetical protein